ncbi:hypothetical protein PT974_08558 [Cladobotryum mycophilum]|uniref:Uncharacterized protein n=1 Tax=Cladobotryum mycophilum TaxID=491253 RepID=A0ABR0SF17_9HYPO
MDPSTPAQTESVVRVATAYEHLSDEEIALCDDILRLLGTKKQERPGTHAQTREARLLVGSFTQGPAALTAPTAKKGLPKSIWTASAPSSRRVPQAKHRPLQGRSEDGTRRRQCIGQGPDYYSDIESASLANQRKKKAKEYEMHPSQEDPDELIQAVTCNEFIRELSRTCQVLERNLTNDVAQVVRI